MYLILTKGREVVQNPRKIEDVICTYPPSAYRQLRGQELLRGRSQPPRLLLGQRRQLGVAAPDGRLPLLPGLLGRPQLLAAPPRKWKIF